MLFLYPASILYSGRRNEFVPSAGQPVAAPAQTAGKAIVAG